MSHCESFYGILRELTATRLAPKCKNQNTPAVLFLVRVLGSFHLPDQALLACLTHPPVQAAQVQPSGQLQQTEFRDSYNYQGPVDTTTTQSLRNTALRGAQWDTLAVGTNRTGTTKKHNHDVTEVSTVLQALADGSYKCLRLSLRHTGASAPFEGIQGLVIA